MLGTETIKLGEWLPDQPYYNNPGLVEAKNTIPIDGSYSEYLGLYAPQAEGGSSSGGAWASAWGSSWGSSWGSVSIGTGIVGRPQGAIAALDLLGDPEIIAGDASKLYQYLGGEWIERGAGYATPTNGYWRFVQFDNYVIATNYSDVPQKRPLGSVDVFEDLGDTGTPPHARQIGVINEFVILGDTDDINGSIPHRIIWPAIGDPTNWPDVGTSAARAVQSGEQYLPSEQGAVTGIAGGQFYGLIFQQRGITRCTYVGGDVVFQFQNIEKQRGCWAPQSLAQIGNLVYFLAADGWYVTDGQTVKPIGSGKIDKTFFIDFDPTYRERVTSGIDFANKIIYWCYPSKGAIEGQPDRVLVYNFIEDRFTHAEDAIQMLFSSLSQRYTLDELDNLFASIDDMSITLDSAQWSGGIPQVAGFTGNAIGTFSGTPKTARFETGEADQNPDGYVFVRGVKPIITGNPTSVTVALAARTAQDNQSRDFGIAVSRTARTGACDFRKQGRYLSARIEIAGGFQKVIGNQFDAVAGSGV